MHLQGLHYTCFYLKMSGKRLQFYAKLLLFCAENAFFVEAGYGCLVLVASNVFAIANPE